MASAPTFGTGNKQAGQACNTDGTNHAKALSVYVSGGDVYVAGHIGEAGILWKNGAATTLDDDGWLFSVFVK